MIERTVITQFYYLQIYDNKDRKENSLCIALFQCIFHILIMFALVSVATIMTNTIIHVYK